MICSWEEKGNNNKTIKTKKQMAKTKQDAEMQENNAAELTDESGNVAGEKTINKPNAADNQAAAAAFTEMKTDDDGFTEVDNDAFSFKKVSNIGDSFTGHYLGELEELKPDSGLEGLMFQSEDGSKFAVGTFHHLRKLLAREKETEGEDVYKNTLYKFTLSEIKDVDKGTYKVFRMFKKVL